MELREHMSVEQARRLILRAQGLDGSWKLPPAKRGVVEAVRRLGYVQIDSINIVQRAHHQTLWSRCAKYRPKLLDELQAKDRGVFEYWAHAAAFLPMDDYRYSLPRMRAYADSAWHGGFLRDHAKLAAEIRSRVRAEGPLPASAFEAPADHPKGSWRNWKPAKRTLEAMFSTGELMVSHRVNFQRYYDLAERVLPPGVDTTRPDEAEAARFGIRRTLANYGLLMARHGWYHGRQSSVQALHELTESGEAVVVEVEGSPGVTFYALRELLERPRRAPRQKALHILSPFDNLVIWRQPLKALFDFDYKLECYVPAPKRRWGYFCLPVLWGDRFIARLDAVADRPSRKLVVRRLLFEAEIRDVQEFLPSLTARLQAFAAFNDCEKVVIETVEPRKLSRCVKLIPKTPI